MDFLDVVPLIQTVGLLGIFLIVFAESGLFFGFFLPGDSLLFTAGVLAAASHFNVWILLLGCFLMAVLGDTVGYWFGHKMGPKIFYKEESWFWSKKNLERTQAFYAKHGNKTITLARFVPVVRTFAPIMAGVGNMKYKTFLFWNVSGALIWTVSMIFGGYFLGNLIPNIDKYILPIVFGIILASLIPIFIEFFRNRRKNRDTNHTDIV